ncbi:DNA-binding transcriptional regulator, AcrR family [Amycolatopsis xylanica]|uniref:DNA-binding transcriptional regulator, AcrR family n=1 Tax=Amycolatopsis xylanica TaxID=589385 RepID=A0A1H3PHB7_9PSEU|nr:DNA-binding transcriptional regulator, AcrR family [Amycolatopsis xylanica]
MILAASTQVIAAQGYDKASMRDIAKAANVTTPVLYDHFSSKTDIYLEVVQHHASNLIASWSETKEAGSAEEFFVQATTTFFTWIKENELSWRILFLDQPRAPEAIEINRQVRRLADEAMAAMITRLPPLDLPESLDIEVATRAISAQVTGAGNALATWWWENRHIPVKTVVELNHGLVWSGLERLIK